jgi:hypothetical protein
MEEIKEEETSRQLVASGIPSVFIDAIDALVFRKVDNQGEIKLSRSTKVGILIEEALLARGAIERDKTREWAVKHQTIYVNGNRS